MGVKLTPIVLLGFSWLGLLVVLPSVAHAQKPTPEVAESPLKTPTFNDIAPIVWEKCGHCHREGEAAPFSLLNFEDVRDHAAQIGEVIASGYMPPWLPVESDFPFENDARLSDDQKKLLTAWIESGSPRGAPGDLPAKPEWAAGWRLGKPDLVVTMPKPFRVPAAGPDIYRNFVIPIPTEDFRYVRALQFRPSNHRVVHHAFMMIDPTRALRRLDGEDGQPGFDGMDTKSAISPNGHFIGWQPGRLPQATPEDMAWQLLPGTDLVLQVHMQCTGKPEDFAASVGLYFTDQAPTRFPQKLVLRSIEIDIPAGEPNFEIQDSITLPVDVDVMAIAPHAHYLGREMYGTAQFPDGSTRDLLNIEDWDLNWQSEYRFKPWVRLPAGTVLKQRFVYDNSADNIRNPHSPPRRVTYGLQATDEMGSLWFQCVPVNDADGKKLQQAVGRKAVLGSIAQKRKQLQVDPLDVDANIGMAKVAIGMKRYDVAIGHLQRALSVKPDSVDATYYLGTTYLRMGNTTSGVTQLNKCLSLDSKYLAAYCDLGHAEMLRKNYKAAIPYLTRALELHEFDVPTLRLMARALALQGEFGEAMLHVERGLRVSPQDKTLNEFKQKLSRAGARK